MRLRQAATHRLIGRVRRQLAFEHALGMPVHFGLNHKGHPQLEPVGRVVLVHACVAATFASPLLPR